MTRLLTLRRVRPFPVSRLPDVFFEADSGAYTDAGVTLATNGQTVRQFNDKSINANNASQATGANQPTFVTNAINGLPVIRPDGVNDFLALASSIVLTGAFYIQAVIRRTANNVSSEVIGNSGGTTYVGISTDGKVYIVDDANAFPNCNYTGTIGATVLCWSRPDAATKVTFRSTGQAPTLLSVLAGTVTLTTLFRRSADFGISDLGALFIKKGADYVSAGTASPLDAYFLTKYGVAIVSAEPQAPGDLDFIHDAVQPSYTANRLSVIGRPADLTGGALTSGSSTLSPSAPVAAFVNQKAAVTVAAGGSAYVGLRNSGGTVYVAAKYDLPNLKIALVAKNGGAEVELGSYTLGGALSAGAVLEFCFTGKTATVLIDGTFYLARDASGTIDVRTAATLSTLRWGMWASGATVTFGNLAYGYFGGLGASDYRPVKDISGNTYQDSNGYIYLACDVHGFGYATSNPSVGLQNWSSQHTAIYQWHPITGAFTEVGKIFATFGSASYSGTGESTTIPGGAGSRPNTTDYAIRYDPDTADFEFTCWGPVGDTNANKVVFYGRLSSIRGITTPTVTGLVPLGGNFLNADFWRSGSTYNLIVGRADSAEPFLFRGSSLATLAQADLDAATGVPSEGAIQLRIGDSWYALFTGGHDYLPSGSVLGAPITAPAYDSLPNSSVAVTWPTVFEYRRNGVTEFRAILFDNATYAQTVLTKDVSLGVDFVPWAQAAFPVSYVSRRPRGGYQAPLVDYGI